MATKTTDFVVLTPEERVAVLRDFVRAAEDEYYRLTLAPSADPTRDERLRNSKTRVDELHAQYDTLMKEIEGK